MERLVYYDVEQLMKVNSNMDGIKRTRLDREQKIWIGLAIGIGLIAILRFFYAITGDYYTFLDEYATFDAAVGYYKTGKFYKWDFHTQSLTDVEYSRAWPHTILLTIWFHIFGIGVPAGKVLSAVFGVLFILSVFYITYKIYRNYCITILSCLFLVGKDSVAVVFRQIRMYSLWLLLIIWFLYFVFMTLESEGSLKAGNRVAQLYNKYLGYPIRYILLLLLFLVLSYATHINTLVTGAGIVFFLFYLLFTKRDRRYITASFLLLISAGIFVSLCFLCAKGIAIPVVSKLYSVLTSDNFIGRYDPQNIRYFYWIRDYFGKPWIMYLVCVCTGVAFLKNIRKRDKRFDFSIYCALIIGSSLYCFIYVFSQYYQDRYMIYVAPLISILAAWGIVESFSLFKVRIVQDAAVIFFAICVALQIKMDFADIYYSDDICYHRQVYDKIQEDAQSVPIAIAGYDFRDYYGVQVFDDYVTAPFDRAHDMEILYEFAKEYPEGYVAVETAKIYGITESMRIFMQNHSERIAGEGIDEWNIDVCRYHFLYPETEQKGMYDGLGRETGCVKYSFEIGDGETVVRIAVDTSKMSPDAKILFLTFGIFTEAKESLPLCYQLVLPQDGTNDVVEYTAVIDKPCIAVELKDDCEVYYTDETYREMKLWEK